MKQRNEKLNIAMLGHKRIPSREGGVEIVVEELSTRMAALGHRVTCYNRGGHHVGGREFDMDAGEMYRGVRLATVPTLDKKGLAAVTSSFFASVRAAFSDADVVHVHAEGPALFCWIPRLLGKKVVVTVHGLNWQCGKWKNGIGSRVILMGERAAVRFAHEIIVLNRATQTYFSETYGRKTVYIPNGADRPEQRPLQEAAEAFSLEKDGYLLFLGRLVPEKGVHYLIEAFRDVQTEKKLVIAGGSSDSTDYISRLKQMAAGDDRILFTGFVQGRMLEELYSNAYLYVLPSDTEGMPLSLLEAMSYGCCCLISDIPGSTEVAEDKAVVFRKGDTEDLKKHLQVLCVDNLAVINMKKPARDFICEKYNWDTVVQKTLELYR